MGDRLPATINDISWKTGSRKIGCYRYLYNVRTAPILNRCSTASLSRHLNFRAIGQLSLTSRGFDISRNSVVRHDDYRPRLVNVFTTTTDGNNNLMIFSSLTHIISFGRMIKCSVPGNLLLGCRHYSMGKRQGQKCRLFSLKMKLT